MRIVAGGTILTSAAKKLDGAHLHLLTLIEVAACVDGFLLIIGMYTPMAGALLVLFSLWRIVVVQQSSPAEVLLATMGVALALIGPGAWSIDARIFGWKRLDLKD
jgi:uncharacterized membrane protein YphA (DoxX/SURF4 family)